MASRQNRRRSTRTSEDAHLHPASPTSPVSPGLGQPSYPPLSPPRPFFIGSRSHPDRGSYSSTDTSPETGSDSDRDMPPAPAPVQQQQQLQAPSQQQHARPPRQQQAKRRSSRTNEYAPVEPGTPNTADPFMTPTERERDAAGWNPAALYAPGQDRARVDSKAPPSSFAFPFQAHPGNPDPGTHIPGVSRRSSVDSLRGRTSSVGHEGSSSYHNGYGQLQQNPSTTELDLGRPNAPFMVDGGAQGSGSSNDGSRPPSVHSASGGSGVGGNMVYRQSAAASATQLGVVDGLPRTGSMQTFRAPFLSPASRPTSSLWAPPSYPYAGSGISAGSMTALGGGVAKGRAPLPSTRLGQKLTKEDKPWTMQKDGLSRLAWWLTFGMMVVGILIGAFVCFRAFKSVLVLKDSDLCMVMNDNFDSLDLQNTWTRDVELGGFGNGEFQACTNEDQNSFIKNNQLYIMPTFTSDDVGGQGNIINGGSLSLDGCTTDNQSACSVSSDGTNVLNPVKSARLNTNGHFSIKFGKVEVRAKLPKGDWLWPAIWMLPVNSPYGEWPIGGEIDLMEARGNPQSYAAQGINFVRSTLNFGPLDSALARIFGWQDNKRETYANGFHTYTLEWTPDFMRFSVDSKLQRMLQLSTKKKSFFEIGNFPKTAQNGTGLVAVTNPWSNGTRAAPFDTDFYLILDLAVGGTSGWFPDGVGGKMWIDGSNLPMTDFAKAQDTWSKTWPSDEDERAFRIDSVKMWKLGSC